jgi:hypothetical protein
LGHELPWSPNPNVGLVFLQKAAHSFLVSFWIVHRDGVRSRGNLNPLTVGQAGF